MKEEMNVKIHQSYKCNFVLCQSCLLLVPTFPSCSTLTLTLRKRFPNKDGSSVDGKSFFWWRYLCCLSTKISLFLLRWSFFSIISVFKSITNLFVLFSEKKLGSESGRHWFHEKRFEILFFKTMFVLLGYPPMAQFALREGNTNAVVLLFSTKTLLREIQKQLLGRNT